MSNWHGPVVCAPQSGPRDRRSRGAPRKGHFVEGRATLRSFGRPRPRVDLRDVPSGKPVLSDWTRTQRKNLLVESGQLGR